MRERCNDENYPEFHLYGGRGIKVCPEWDGKGKFPVFCQWAVENNYADDLTIERVDNEKGYSPDNCKWADKFEQANNKRSNVWFDCPDGQRRTLAQIARKEEVSYKLLSARLLKTPTISYAELVKKPVPGNQYGAAKLVNGKLLRQIAEETGIAQNTLRYRLSKNPNITYEQLTVPLQKCPAAVNGKSLHEIANETGLPYATLYSRLYHNPGIAYSELVRQKTEN
jgi:lambda repressor-like predicted transcriptional regulator